MSLSISCVETQNYAGAVRAVKSTLANTPAIKVYWISDRPFPESLHVPVEWIRVPPVAHRVFCYWYSNITLRLLPHVVSTDHNILVQADGFAVNGSAWTDEFLQYDYIGAPWLWWEPHEQIGNGGFSLRSRRLYDAFLAWEPGYRNEDWPNLPAKYYNPNGREGIMEDNLIGGPFRPVLEQRYGIKYAPVELAHRWSIEGSESYSNEWFKRSLGFHGRETAQHYGIEL